MIKITLEDPYQGSTAFQERAYAELERMHCQEIQHLPKFMEEYMDIAVKIGRAYMSPELSEKFR